MRIYSSMLTITLLAASPFVVACANDTLRAQTPTTTTGPYNTGTTATPGLSAGKAAHAFGEDPRRAVGDVAPASSAETSTTSAPVNAPASGGTSPRGQ